MYLELPELVRELELLVALRSVTHVRVVKLTPDHPSGAAQSHVFVSIDNGPLSASGGTCSA